MCKQVVTQGRGEGGQGAAAHVCYLLAGLRPEAFSGEARLCAVGWDHHFCRRGWTNPAPLLRTQVLEWALPTPPGASPLPPPPSPSSPSP